MAHRLIALSFLYLGLWGVAPARAQRPSDPGDTATITGQVVASETQASVRNAAVQVMGTPTTTTTDSAGRFALAGLPPGLVLLEVRAVGYASGNWRMNLRPGQVLDSRFELDLLAYNLPEVVVEADRRETQRRYADFERRRHSRMGYFITKEQIEHANPTALIDILVRVRGVQQVCLTNDCFAKMARSPPGCYPQYFLDGRESTPYFARNTPPHDIQGIEIYRGGSETPGEFTGPNSGCGVIAIWTKSYP
jgi:hypothetical protein